MNLSCSCNFRFYTTCRSRILATRCISSSRVSQWASNPVTTKSKCRVHQRRQIHLSRAVRALPRLNGIRSFSHNTSYQESEKDEIDQGVGTRPVGGRRTRPWGKRVDPYSDSGREKLKSLVQDLQTITKHALKEQEMKKQSGSDDPYLPFATSRSVYKSLPESPVTRKIRKVRVHKRSPSDEEERLLASNPWAQMLAKPVRLCQATGIRVPASLLSDWGLTQHPVNHKVYLMPNDLAGVKNTAQHNLKARALEEGNDAGDETRAVSEPKTVLPPLRLLPYHGLLKHLTMLVSKNNKTPYRLTPLRWKSRFESDKTYRKYQDGVETADDQDGSNTSNTRTGFNLTNLKWQTDIDVRLLEIMRSRTLTALEKLGKHCSSGRARHQKRILSMAIPLDGRLILEDGKIFGQDTNSNPSQPIDLDNGEELHAKEDIKISDDDMKSIISWLPGSILLHIGHEDLMLPLSQSKNLPALPENPLIPPVISVNDTFRLPVFSLSTLLGPNHYSKLETVLQTFDVLQAPRTGASSAKPSDYLILVKSTTGPTIDVVKELWQLWRYVGGSNPKNEIDHTS